MAVTDLPDPDSPTIPKISPGRTSNETPSTARTAPASVLNVVLRLRTERMAAVTRSPEPGVEGVAQPVPDEHEGHDGQENGCGREEQQVGGGEQEAPSLGDHEPPRRRRLGHACAKEGESSLGQHGGSDEDRAVDDDGLDGVGQDVADDQAPVLTADGARRFDVVRLSRLEHRGAEQACDRHPPEETEDDDHTVLTTADDGDDDDGGENVRKGQEDVGGPHEQAVEFPPVEAGHGSDDEPDRRGDEYGQHADPQRDAGAVHDAGEEVATQHVGAEPVVEAGLLPAGRAQGLGVVGRDKRGEDGGGHHQPDHDQPGHRQLVAPEPPPHVAPDR